MNSLLKTVHSLAGNKRNLLVRDSLQKQLNTSVMEMQSAPGIETAVGDCDETMTLCSVLEAVFLHGLKDSLLNRVTEALSGPDFDAMPQPSFWGPLLVFSHRQIIDQILGLSQVTTEVGYCRAWIRLALNEGMLASYFCSIRRNNSALKPYYNRSAYIRDVDLVEVAQRLVENLDYVRFELACNSSLLNFWSSTPLLIAGIWSPPMKSCPVFSAVDIAKTITTELTDNDNFDEVETASSIGSSIGIGSFNSSQSVFNNVASITEDEALKIILANERSNIARQLHGSTDASNIQDSNITQQLRTNTTNNREPEKRIPEEDKEEINKVQQMSNGNAEKRSADNNVADAENRALQDTSVDNKAIHDAAAATVGNSLIGKLGWSTSFEECQSSLTSSVISHGSGASCVTPGDGPTYDALIQSYQTAGNSSVSDLKEFLKKYPKKATSEEGSKAQVEPKVVIDFEEQLGNIPREKGLDVQNYSCLECGHAIGMTFSKAHVCSYSGSYYCSKCMAEGQYIIPSRMIHNWDLKQYPVSRKAASYLESKPALLDLKTLNPKIYMAVDTMAQLQSLRIQLNLLRAYLFTCREPIIESLQKKVAPRDYLYEHVHQYSVTDLLDIPNGILTQQLQKVVEFARDHVVNCWLCSQKGFICEVCNNPKVIYPFDMETTFRCGACNAVFHADCLNASKPCPKCERKRKRMDMPLLDMGCTDLPSSVSSSPIDAN